MFQCLHTLSGLIGAFFFFSLLAAYHVARKVIPCLVSEPASHALAACLVTFSYDEASLLGISLVQASLLDKIRYICTTTSLH
jgi:hypothetical protein